MGNMVFLVNCQNLMVHCNNFNDFSVCHKRKKNENNWLVCYIPWILLGLLYNPLRLRWPLNCLHMVAPSLQKSWHALDCVDYTRRHETHDGTMAFVHAFLGWTEVLLILIAIRINMSKFDNVKMSQCQKFKNVKIWLARKRFLRVQSFSTFQWWCIWCSHANGTRAASYAGSAVTDGFSKLDNVVSLPQGCIRTWKFDRIWP